MKKLTFDAKEDEGEVDDLELTLNGRKVYVQKPTTGQVTIMMAAFAEDVPAPEAAKALLDFYKDISIRDYAEWDEEKDEGIPGTELPTAYDEVRAVLRNPKVTDSLEQMMDLTEKVIEAFTGNPTKPPTDYLPSRRSGGRSSTARRPASTRSRSRRPGSATGSTASSSAG
jgi:hypothetical protein